MDTNPWGHKIIESFKNLDIIHLYANEEEPGMYGDIDTTEERLRREHPDMGDKLMKGFGVIWHTTGMSPDSSKDWYDTIEEAREYVVEVEKELAEEKQEWTSPVYRQSVIAKDTELTLAERKTLIEALEELQIYRQADEEPRAFAKSGLYEDEVKVIEKLR